MIRPFSIALTLVLTAFSVSAQSDPIKVGEYRAAAFDRVRVENEVKILVERLAKEPKTTRGAIAFMNGFKFKGPCVDNRPVEDKDLERSIKANIPRTYRNRIVLVPAEQWGLAAEARFYLVPAGAEPPARIEWIVDPPCCCHSIRVEGPVEVGKDSKTVRYRVIFTPSRSKTRPRVEWKVVGGSIIAGNGSLEIRVKPDSLADEITVAATAISASAARCGCDQGLSHTTKLLPK